MVQIWTDPAVAGIFTIEEGEPKLLIGDLWWSDDESLVLRATRADMNADPQAPSELAFINACVTGIAAFERLSRHADPGWKRFLAFITGANVDLLWRLFKKLPESVIFAGWVLESVESIGATKDVHAEAMRSVYDRSAAILTEAQYRGDGTAAGDTARALVASILPPEKDFTEEPSYNQMEHATKTLEQLKRSLESVGLSCVEVDVGEIGRAAFVQIDDSAYATVSVSARGSKPSLVYIVGGVSNHVSARRELVLEGCNIRNLAERNTVCVFYPDAYGASILIRVALVPAVLIQVPPFFAQMVRDTAGEAMECARNFRGRGISGTPFSSDPGDVRELAKICCL